MLDERHRRVARLLETAEESKLDASQVRDFWDAFPDPSRYGAIVTEFLPEHAYVHELLLDAVASTLPPAARVLDLGAGSGRVARMVMERSPDCRVTLVDASTTMLDAASETLAGFTGRYETVAADFFADPPDFGAATFDGVVSVLAICQARDLDQFARLYAEVHHWLKTGGVFVCLDHVRGANALATTLNVAGWQEFMSGTFGSDQAEAAVVSAYQLDNPVPLPEHLRLLAEAGFRETDVLYKRDIFALYAGYKY